MAEQPLAIPTHRKILYLSVIVVALLAVGEIGLRTRQWIRYGGFATSVRDPMLDSLELGGRQQDGHFA